MDFCHKPGVPSAERSRVFEAFVPRAYVERNFPREMDEVNRFILGRQVDFFAGMRERRGPRVLEVGVGPAIPYLTTPVGAGARIVCADVCRANLRFLEDFRDGVLPAWARYRFEPYVAFVVEREGQTLTERSVRQRLDETRSAIEAIRWVDVFDRRSMWLDQSWEECFDTVISNFCVESATGEDEEFQQGLDNLCWAVKLQGTLVMSAMTEATEYQVGDAVFPACPITLTGLRESVEARGFTVTDTDELRLEDAEGLAGVMWMAASRGHRGSSACRIGLG